MKLSELPLGYDFETKAILKQLGQTHRQLAELKGISHTIPNEQILISTLALQEAKESSAIENIVTTRDDLYQTAVDISSTMRCPAAKEILNYREAILCGYRLIQKSNLLTVNMIKEIHRCLEPQKGDFRKLPGTQLKDATGQIIYTPPQHPDEILNYMTNLEQFINDESLCALDPLIKIALIHHQFESIHPFYDGNGRTGRIINVLYLVKEGILDFPILYLSRFIIQRKGDYYQLIQAIRDAQEGDMAVWEAWILFILKGLEETAKDAIQCVRKIGELMQQYKSVMRVLFGKHYQHELLNNLFYHPYTKIEHLGQALQMSRPTATRYLSILVNAGLLEKLKLGRENYYINAPLLALFTREGEMNGRNV